MKKRKINKIGSYRIGCSKRIVLGLFLLFSTLLFAASSEGQTGEIEFEHISIEQGLSQGSVNCILQDNRGFMWFGTQNGLNRYDGHEFKTYTQNSKNPYSLSHTIVISIYKDHEGILWIGTYGGGLNEFDPKTEKFTNHKNHPGQFEILKNQNVRANNEDNSRILLVGTDDGLYIRKPGESNFAPYQNQDGKTIPKVKVIFKDGVGNVWIGAETGLYKYNQDTRDFTLSQIVPGNSFYNEVDAIDEAQPGILWIGTSVGLYRFEQENKKFTPHPGDLKDKQINVIFKDHSGITWIGTLTDGLTRLDVKDGNASTYKNIPNDLTSLSSNNVSAIYQDNSGLLWIGTSGGGINRFDPGGKQFKLYKNIPGKLESLNYNDIRGIREDKDEMIWIGTNGGGINRFDPDTKTFKHYLIGKDVCENPRRNNVHCIFMDHDGKLWVGTVSGGLYTFDPNKKKFAHYHNKDIARDEYVLEIREDENMRLWIGTLDNGLTVLDEKREKSRNFKNIADNPDSLSNNKIFSIYEKSGILWVGTGGGGLNKLSLDKFNFDGNVEKFNRFQPDTDNPGGKSISDNFISAIYQDQKGTLWIGTGGGLNKLINEKEKSFRVYTREDGLPDNVIYAIREDNSGNLWLSTNRGLAKFNLREDNSGNLWLSTNRGLAKFNPGTDVFRNYSVKDGLQGYEFNRGSACKSRSGIMYFGGFNGFNVFDPGKIQDDFPPPPIVITSFKKLNKGGALEASTSASGELKLSYRDSFFSFGFAALSFADPGNNQYAYKLEPINRDWLYLGNKHDIDFTNIKPGSYTLRVKGANSHGVWNEQGAALKITVSSPFWVTWWFYLLVVMVLIAGISGFVKLRTKNVEKLNRRLEKQVDQRTDEIIQQKEELKETNESLKKEIEERRQAEAALKESEERYRTLVETSPDAIVLSDIQDGRIIMANPQSAVLCGYTDVAEMRAHVNTIFELMEEKSRESAHKNAVKVKKRGVNRNTEYTILSKKGAPIAVEISTSLVEDAEEKPQYFLSIIRDIRDRKEAEQKEKLQREKLIQVDKMVSLGRLVSGVAHELNNPASSIKMNSEIFDRMWKDVAPVLEEHYKMNSDFSMAGLPYIDAKSRLEDLIIGSMESSQRIEKIIKDLRDFSRPGDPLTSEPIDINKVIRSSVSLTHNLLQKSTKHFSLELMEDLPVLLGNPQKLEQVIINLIQNACQALPENTKGISISTAHNKEKNHIVSQVKDEGEGIEEKNLQYITDPFYTTRRERGGTGLGLSISMQIIRDHGGTINFESRVGKGTTVTVSLPVINASAPGNNQV